jgi:hypothetical protein
MPTAYIGLGANLPSTAGPPEATLAAATLRRSMVFCLESCYALLMQIMIDIPDELAAQAKARGLTPKNYVRSLIDGGLQTDPAPLPPAKPKRDLETFFRAMAANSAKIPQLPDEAFTRESFYQDHD